MIGYYTDIIEEEKVKMAVMCPNAEIVLCTKENRLDMIKLAKGRRKQKGFTIDTGRFLWSHVFCFSDETKDID